MSFFWTNNVRNPNTAEVAANQSKVTAVNRQKRIADFVPTLMKYVLDAVKTMSNTELAESQMTFDLPVILNTVNGRIDMLYASFINVKVPLPNSAEMEYLAKEIKTKLEDPAVHGFSVSICAEETCRSKNKMFTVDWNVPRVPPEPLKPTTQDDKKDEKKEDKKDEKKEEKKE